MSTTATRSTAVATAVLATLVVAACGTGDTGPSGTASPTATSEPPTTPATPVGGAESAVVDEVFHVLSPWNTTVVGDVVDPDSAALLTQSGGAAADALLVDTARPVPVAVGGVPTTMACRSSQCGDGSDDLVVPVPADVDPDPRADGLLAVLDPATGVGYDFGRARREADGTVSYHFVREWDLDGPGFNQPDVDGVRGSGLPLFAGLVRPDELEAGLVDHALAIGLPALARGYYVQPASASDGSGVGAVPAGARIRLRGDLGPVAPLDPATGAPLPVDDEQRRRTGVLVETLQQYGAIVVGHAEVPTLYVQAGEPGGSETLAGYELTGVGLSDFEVLDLGGLTRFPTGRGRP